MRGAAAFVLVVMVLGAGAATATATSVFNSFPLWKDVPVKQFATLKEGRAKGGRWAVYGFRHARGARWRDKPCLHLARITSDGRYGDVGGCDMLAPRGGVGRRPLLVSMSEAGSGRSLTYFAATFASEIVNVRLDFDDGTSMRRTPERIGKRRAQKARVEDFKLLAATVSRDVCIQRVVGLNSRGETVLDAASGEC